MNNYFEVKAKVKRIDNVTGKEKQVSEQYLVNALSFTEAESRTNSYLEEETGEFSVMAIKKSNIESLLQGEEEKYYLAKIEFMEVDDNGKVKTAKTNLLLTAETPDSALTKVKEHTSTWMTDNTLVALQETAILDYIQ
ncbi:MAG: DUF4494 family protein [Bacteriovoracaceae bacterium]